MNNLSLIFNSVPGELLIQFKKYSLTSLKKTMYDNTRSNDSNGLVFTSREVFIVIDNESTTNKQNIPPKNTNIVILILHEK